MMMKHLFVRRTASIGAGLAAFALLAAAGLCYRSYLEDCAKLGYVARGITKGLTAPEEQTLALLTSVSKLEGSARNNGRFILSRLRATPTQVLESGGDCADRSRLLCALLREKGIPATMAMCFDPRSHTPAHTFVEVTLAEGRHMAVDPAYHLYFPREGAPGYYDLLDLRRDPGILPRRIDTICRETPAACLRRFYMRPSVGFETASTFNWDRNALTRALHGLLGRAYGEAVYRIRRPAVLEEPKLLIATACAISGLAVVLALAGSCCLRRRHRAGPQPISVGSVDAESFLKVARA